MVSDEFKVLDEKLDRVLKYMDERFGDLETRMESGFFKNDQDHDRIMGVLDHQTKMISTLDQERLFGIERIKRVENEVLKLKNRMKMT